MTAPDPTAGEPIRVPVDDFVQRAIARHPASPSAVAASTGTSEDVDTVARVLIAAWEAAEGKPVNVSYVATHADMARAVLASDWLAAQKAAARAEERERIARDLARSRFYDARDAEVAARIAREVRP